ncbi:hypothetical protein FH972_009805 [Carpinus fangiana]|uniref:Uncharacterized protein n=1 Tax=Carpinus fangiana TaxID=176857 RepID=A0A660KPJ2_9ROSI|nr:hypothetical protein FH972_009805 [Carpinus fangiana]
MDPKKSSFASQSLAPSPSIDPPPLPFDASTSTAQECLIALGLLCGEDHTKAVEAILSRHPEIMCSSRSLLHYKMASLIHNSTACRLECLNDAVESHAKPKHYP